MVATRTPTSRRICALPPDHAARRADANEQKKQKKQSNKLLRMLRGIDRRYLTRCFELLCVASAHVEGQDELCITDERLREVFTKLDGSSDDDGAKFRRPEEFQVDEEIRGVLAEHNVVVDTDFVSGAMSPTYEPTSDWHANSDG